MVDGSSETVMPAAAGSGGSRKRTCGRGDSGAGGTAIPGLPALAPGPRQLEMKRFLVDSRSLPQPQPQDPQPSDEDEPNMSSLQLRPNQLEWIGLHLPRVFTKCDKVKKGKGGWPDENIKVFQETISELYPEPPPWIMTSSTTGLGRDELLHMSQLRNYWNNEAA